MACNEGVRSACGLCLEILKEEETLGRTRRRYTPGK